MARRKRAEPVQALREALVLKGTLTEAQAATACGLNGSSVYGQRLIRRAVRELEQAGEVTRAGGKLRYAGKGPATRKRRPSLPSEVPAPPEPAAMQEPFYMTTTAFTAGTYTAGETYGTYRLPRMEWRFDPAVWVQEGNQ